MPKTLTIFKKKLQLDTIYEIELNNEFPVDADTEETIVGDLDYAFHEYSINQWGRFKGPFGVMGKMKDLVEKAGPRMESCEILFEGTRIEGHLIQRICRMLQLCDVNRRIIDSFKERLQIRGMTMPRTGFFYVDIHDDVEWQPGKYREAEGSCWWKMSNYAVGRMQFRHMCRKHKAFALRLYSLEDDDTFTPAGRCFAAQLDKNTWGIFNPYGPPLNVFATLLERMIQIPYERALVDLDPHIYINGGSHFIFSTDFSKWERSEENKYYCSNVFWSDYEYDNMEFESDYAKHIGRFSSGLVEGNHFCAVCEKFDAENECYRTTHENRVCQECVNALGLKYLAHRNRYVDPQDTADYIKADVMYCNTMYRGTWVHDSYYHSYCNVCNTTIILNNNWKTTCKDCQEKDNDERSTESVTRRSEEKVKGAKFRYSVQQNQR